MTVWAHISLLAIELDVRLAYTAETPEPITTAARVADGWLIVEETKVELRTRDLYGVAATHEHGEVILEADLVGDRVVVRDFNGVQFALEAASLRAVT